MRRIVLVFFAFLLTAEPVDLAQAAPRGPVDTTHSANAPEYLLSPGDKLKITVFNVTSLSGEYAIGPGDDIALLLIGSVKASGSTVSSLSKTLHDALADGFVNNPKVTVEVLNYSPCYILGEVNKPGQFPFMPSLTVEQAVATAGGYTYRAARRKAYLRHPGGAEQLVKFGTDPAYVQPGDTIRIGERYL